MNNLENSVLDISNNHYRYLMSLENVNGVGLSYKYINNTNTFEPCVSVFVENKVKSNFLTSNNVIPKMYMGIKTDVVPIGKLSLSVSGVLFFKMRPLQGGAVIGPVHDRVSGTICCIVKKVKKKGFKKKVRYYILSNNHVLANNNRYPIGTLFIQPNLIENGDISEDIVAALDTFIPIKFREDDPESENLVDAGIAEIFNLSDISNKIYSQGKIKGTTDPALLMIVKKVGYKTGVTHGHIVSSNASFDFNTGENTSAIFKNQILSDLNTAPGDSGSAILTGSNQIVGMHMGSTKEGFSIANNINTVLKKLNVTLYTG